MSVVFRNGAGDHFAQVVGEAFQLGFVNTYGGLAVDREMKHVTDEWLEQYSRGALVEPQLGQLEEHLLTCEHCCERLTRFDDSWGLNG